MPVLILLILSFQSVCMAVTYRTTRADSRRVLAVALVALLPVAGALLVLLVYRVRGGGVALEVEEPTVATRALGAADVRRLADLPPLLDRLTSPDAAERLAALITVSNNTGADGINVLRWAVEHGAPEVVLDAALTLEELELRREARLGDTRAALDAAPTYDRAIAAAMAAADGILSGVADAVSVPALADQARASYLVAQSLEPHRSDEIHVHLARLELAAMRPSAAMEFLARVSSDTATMIASGVRQLRDDVAFAARRFDLVSERELLSAYTPTALHARRVTRVRRITRLVPAVRAMRPMRGNAPMRAGVAMALAT